MASGQGRDRGPCLIKTYCRINVMANKISGAPWQLRSALAVLLLFSLAVQPGTCQTLDDVLARK